MTSGRLDRPPGRVFLDTHGEPLRDAGGLVVGAVSATVDLTPMRLAEEQARRQLEDLRAASSASGDRSPVAGERGATRTRWNGRRRAFDLMPVVP